MRDSLNRVIRRGVLGALLLLVPLLLLAACSSGDTATPPPSAAGTSAPGSATAGLPAPPTATLPPTPPTGTAARASTPTPPPPATASRAATPGEGRRQTATVAPIVPVGERPAGWLVYTSPTGFTLAYPPDWLPVADAAHGLFYLYSPDPARTTFLVIASGAPERTPNLDVLRDRWFQARSARCARFAVDATSQERFSGLDFATVGTTCDLPGGLAYSLTGIGLRGDIPWIYELDAPYADFAATRAAVFAPILATWQIGR